jgi:hypothetical protein
MKLPYGERAIVDDRKLLKYILNSAHPHGRTHAILFERLLGITKSNAEILRSSLLRAAADGEAIDTGDEGFGTKYEIRFSMDGRRGKYIVLSVWIVERDGADVVPRLVTAYIE